MKVPNFLYFSLDLLLILVPLVKKSDVLYFVKFLLKFYYV